MRATDQAFAAATTFLWYLVERRAARPLSERKLDARFFQCSWLVSAATEPNAPARLELGLGGHLLKPAGEPLPERVRGTLPSRFVDRLAIAECGQGEN